MLIPHPSRHHIFLCAIVGIFLLLVSSSTWANLIVNGSFELSAAGTPATFSGISGATNNPATYPYGWTGGLGSRNESSWWSESQGGGWIPNAQDGNYLFNLDSNHGSSNPPPYTGNYIEQTITTVADQEYSLSFWFRGEASHNVPPDETVLLDISGAYNLSTSYITPRIIPPGPTDPYTQIIVNFHAGGGALTIRFTDDDANIDSGVVLDNVVLLAVPETSTYVGGAMLIGLLAGAHIWRRRCKPSL